MDSMEAALPRNFCEMTSALLHIQIWAQFGCGFGCGSIKNVFSNLFLTWIEKVCLSKLSDPLEIRAAKKFQIPFTLSCLKIEP